MKKSAFLFLPVAIALLGCSETPSDPESPRTAKWALELGGTVTLAGSAIQYKKTEALPDGKFAIEKIILNNSEMTDDDLPKLWSLKHLKHLELHSTNLSNPGIETLTTINSLVHLELSNTNITDDGLRKLTELKNLKKLYIHNNQLSQGAIDDFQAKLKACEVYH